MFYLRSYVCHSTFVSANATDSAGKARNLSATVISDSTYDSPCFVCVNWIWDASITFSIIVISVRV
jgi:hypothetical protein